ncbi:MAG: hypothetical protein ABW127_19180 [Candidatus Thiodiazotropha endolucinida]
MYKNLPPFFYYGGILPEELEEDIKFEEYPFLASQAAIIQKELYSASQQGGKNDNVVPEAWEQVKEVASITRSQLRQEWGMSRNKKPRYRLIQELRRLSDRKACGQDVPQKLFNAVLYGVVVAGIMEPKWHDKPVPDDGTHPGEPYIRQLSVKQVQKAVNAACDPKGMLNGGKGGRPKGSIHDFYINEVVKIWVNVGGKIKWSRTTNPMTGDKEPTGPLIRYVTACLFPIDPVIGRLSDEGIVKILTAIRNRM